LDKISVVSIKKSESHTSDGKHTLVVFVYWMVYLLL